MSFQLAMDALASTSHRDAVSHPILESVAGPLRSSLEDYPWAVQKENLPLLTSFGIPSSGLGTMPHPHPSHKTIETHLLFTHWHHMCNEPSTVLFMKKQKFLKLQRKNKNFSRLLNYRLTAKDSVRFEEVDDLLPSTSTVFMHDALMYFSPEQVLGFFKACPQMSKLFCSLVVPAESSFTDQSFYPSLYTMQYHMDDLHYTPEGHSAGSYNQPYVAVSWLKHNYISCPGLTLSISILESFGPQHSILIQRGTFPSDTQKDVVSFRIPPCILLPQAQSLSQDLRDRLVPEKVYNNLFFLCSLCSHTSPL